TCILYARRSLLATLLMCFGGQRAHEQVVSFPTRRSSDLDLLVEGKHHVPCHGHKYQCPGGQHKPGNRFIAVPVSANELTSKVSDNHIYYRRQCAQQSLRIECDALAMIQMIFSKDDQVQLQRRVACQAVRIIWVAECVHQYPISDEGQDGEKINKLF